MAILATGVTKVSGKVADTSGEVVLTAADVGAAKSISFVTSSPSSAYFIKLAEANHSVADKLGGISGIISGSGKYGNGPAPEMFISATIRNRKDGSADIYAAMRKASTTLIESTMVFSVLNGDSTEIWLKTSTYPYNVRFIPYHTSGFTVIEGGSAFTTAPAGIVTEVRPFEIYHSGNVVGSGGIIERGSNSNGEYVKFADGTMICTTSALTQEIVSGASNTTWTFPSQFSSTTYTTSVTSSGGVSSWVCAFMAGLEYSLYTHISGVLVSGLTSTGSRTIQATAIGRWK